MPQVRTSVPGPKMFFSNAFTRSVQRALVGASPRLFVPGTLVRTWGTRPISWDVVGGPSNYGSYLRQTLVSWKMVGVSKQTYRPVPTGFCPTSKFSPAPSTRDQLLGGPPRRVSSPRLRPGSTLGLGFGAFLVSFLPLSLLPMEPNITRMAGQSEMPPGRRRKP